MLKQLFAISASNKLIMLVIMMIDFFNVHHAAATDLTFGARRVLRASRDPFSVLVP
jgi:hypothetical protein